MDIVSLLIQALGGAIGGNIIGQLSRALSTGTLGNTVLGAIGGAIGAYVLPKLGIPAQAIDLAGSVDWQQILTQLGFGAGSGAVVSGLIAAIRNATSRSA